MLHCATVILPFSIILFYSLALFSEKLHRLTLIHWFWWSGLYSSLDFVTAHNASLYRYKKITTQMSYLNLSHVIWKCICIEINQWKEEETEKWSRDLICSNAVWFTLTPVIPFLLLSHMNLPSCIILHIFFTAVTLSK